jgi:hypothetical protein
MLRRTLTVLVLAVPLAAADLAHKAVVETPFWAYHVRSGGWVVLSLGVLAGCLLLARVPSLVVAVGAGILAGGVAGNVGSALTSEQGVHNPIVLETDSHVIALNLADVFTLTGIALLMSSLVVVSVRNRERLLPPRSFVRALRRRVSSR